jgi:hypothetical protein
MSCLQSECSCVDLHEASFANADLRGIGAILFANAITSEVQPPTLLLRLIGCTPAK